MSLLREWRDGVNERGFRIERLDFRTFARWLALAGEGNRLSVFDIRQHISLIKVKRISCISGRNQRQPRIVLVEDSIVEIGDLCSELGDCVDIQPRSQPRGLIFAAKDPDSFTTEKIVNYLWQVFQF